jgi:hypothetical protein
MKTKAILASIVSLVLGLGMFATAGADPDESQRLRGLGGRTFAVVVTDLWSADPPFENCYTFNEDGSWDDPLFLPGFPVPGTWVQDSTGAATTYTAVSIFPIGGGLAVQLTQVGTVTPAGGHGVLQLNAFNDVDIVLESDPSVVIVELTELTSVGHQDNECGS